MERCFLTIEEIMTDTIFQMNMVIENEMCLKKCVIAFFKIKKLRFTKNNPFKINFFDPYLDLLPENFELHQMNMAGSFIVHIAFREII